MLVVARSGPVVLAVSTRVAEWDAQALALEQQLWRLEASRSEALLSAKEPTQGGFGAFVERFAVASWRAV